MSESRLGAEGRVTKSIKITDLTTVTTKATTICTR